MSALFEPFTPFTHENLFTLMWAVSILVVVGAVAMLMP